MSGPRQGRQAEEFIRRRFDLDPPEAEWHDGVDPDGIKYEIKSAQETVSAGDNKTESGRFRLWEDQHRSLTASKGQIGEAYYVFIVSNREAVKVSATEVTEWVNELDGWNKAGHSRRDSRQKKIPVDFVYDQV